LVSNNSEYIGGQTTSGDAPSRGRSSTFDLMLKYKLEVKNTI
jgi:hypothetical protein